LRDGSSKLRIYSIIANDLIAAMHEMAAPMPNSFARPTPSSQTAGTPADSGNDAADFSLILRQYEDRVRRATERFRAQA
jgi:hypothetical protein